MQKLEKDVKKNLVILIVLNASVILVSVIYVLLFRADREAFDCVIKNAFGFYCPGCGGSRSVSALFDFDLVTSFVHYPPIIISAIVILSYDVRLLLSVVKNNIMYTKDYKFYPFLLIPISIILNFAIRNILLLFGIDYIGDIL